MSTEKQYRSRDRFEEVTKSMREQIEEEYNRGNHKAIIFVDDSPFTSPDKIALVGLGNASINGFPIAVGDPDMRYISPEEQHQTDIEERLQNLPQHGMAVTASRGVRTPSDCNRNKRLQNRLKRKAKKK